MRLIIAGGEGMKQLFFTSNTKHYHKVNEKRLPNKIDNTNGIVDQLKQRIDENDVILFIAASPDDREKVDRYTSLIFKGFQLSGITFSEYLILDGRTKDQAKEYINRSNVIFLSGGDTYIENEFFQQLHLKELLKNFDGIIIGQSAGSINMAEYTYNSPEEGEASEPIYFEGLGLSNLNIEPHFVLDTTGFDEMQMYQRKHLLEESKRRPIYALCDGSHIFEDDDSIIVYGKAFLVKDGVIEQICDDRGSRNINQSQEKKHTKNK